MTLKLHCFGESGNAYKAALPLELAGLDWTAEYVDFFNGAHRSPEFLALNPMGEVPVFIDGDLILSQSGAIQDWITAKTGKFGGTTEAETREILRWQFWDNHKGSSQFGPTRFYLNFLPEAKRSPDVAAYLSGRVKAALKVLNDVLSTQDFLVGGRLTMADLSCCAYLYYPEPFGYDAETYPAIAAWLERISQTPGWKHPYDLMPGSPADRA
ncbi:MAG: glutathione S-transferase family protein [Maritimibacter sp.]